MKVWSCRPPLPDLRHREQLGYVVRHRGKPSSYRVVAVKPKQVQGRIAQRGQHRCTGAAIAVIILMELGVAEPVPAFNAPAVPHLLQQGSGVVCRLVRKRCRWREGFPSRLPLTTSSTIQLLSGQASVMKSGACLALSVQVVSRP